MSSYLRGNVMKNILQHLSFYCLNLPHTWGTAVQEKYFHNVLAFFWSNSRLTSFYYFPNFSEFSKKKIVHKFFRYQTDLRGIVKMSVIHEILWFQVCQGLYPILFKENSVFTIVFSILCKNASDSVQGFIDNIQAKVSFWMFHSSLFFQMFLQLTLATSGWTT